MRDVPMANTTAMHSEKSAIVLTAYHYHNNQVLDKSSNCHRKARDWLLILVEQVKARRAENVDVRMNQHG